MDFVDPQIRMFIEMQYLITYILLTYKLHYVKQWDKSIYITFLRLICYRLEEIDVAIYLFKVFGS